MNRSQLSKSTYSLKLGALGALGTALCYVVGFVMIFWIEPGVNLHAEKKLNFILQNGRLFQAWYFFIFVGFSLFFLLLLRAIKAWIGSCETIGYCLINMFGFIWASYIFICGLISILTIQYVLSVPGAEQKPIWMVIFIIQNGLGDGSEWVGGIWLVTVSWYLLNLNRGPKALNVIGITSGFAGCLTVLPGFAFAGVIFGLSQLIWFILIARHLLSLSNTYEASLGDTITR